MKNRIVLTLLFIAVNLSELAAQNVVPVTIEEEGDCYRLLRGGEEYYIKGAGGQDYLDRVKDYGGNSIRLWSSKDTQSSGKTVMELLDEAESLGLTVTLGLWVTHPRHNPTFYDDPDKVTAQLETFRSDVQMYRNHPALLMWAVGNEVHLNTQDTRVWDAVGDIAAMIKAEDPNHPVTTVTANINSTIVEQLNTKAPDLDILGINAYGNELLSFPQKVRNAGWTKPYFMGEYGPDMHWQVSGTAWGAKFEPDNSTKAATYRDAYQAFKNDQCLCIGSYVFKWGWKWERTYSWINLFTPEGQETEMVDIMHLNWKGELPGNRAPVSDPIALNGNKTLQSITLEPGSINNATSLISDPDNDPISVQWVLYEEGTSNASGGDAEPVPPTVEGFILEDHTDSILFKAPEYGGPFRLYVFAYDTANNVSVSNYPFFVSNPVITFEGDSLLPVADTYARGGTYASQNFGNNNIMVTKTTPNESFTRDSYLKFNVGEIKNSITEASLHLYGTVTDGTPIQVFGSYNTNWSETGLTWNNRPAADTLLGEIYVSDDSSLYCSWDVGGFVSDRHARGFQFVTLVLKAKNETEKEIPWNTKEAGTKVPILTFSRDTTRSNLELTTTALVVGKGKTVPITNDHLNTSGNYPTAVIYKIVQVPLNGVLIRNSIVLSEGAEFRQADINGNLIAYRHNNNTAESDSFKFGIHDPTGTVITDQQMNIIIDQSVGTHFFEEKKPGLYPNPATDYIYIESASKKELAVECFNILGEKQTLFNHAGYNRYDISKLPTGIYLVKVTTGSQTSTLRFVKKQ